MVGLRGSKAKDFRLYPNETTELSNEPLFSNVYPSHSVSPQLRPSECRSTRTCGKRVLTLSGNNRVRDLPLREYFSLVYGLGHSVSLSLLKFLKSSEGCEKDFHR